jgi:hypothetical protein
MHVHTPLADGPGKPTGAARFPQAQAGDRDSLNGLMMEHDGLVQAVVRRQVLGNLPFAEALQAGRIGLWQRHSGLFPQWGQLSPPTPRPALCAKSDKRSKGLSPFFADLPLFLLSPTPWSLVPLSLIALSHGA